MPSAGPVSQEYKAFLFQYLMPPFDLSHTKFPKKVSRTVLHEERLEKRSKGVWRWQEVCIEMIAEVYWNGSRNAAGGSKTRLTGGHRIVGRIVGEGPAGRRWNAFLYPGFQVLKGPLHVGLKGHELGRHAFFSPGAV